MQWSFMKYVFFTLNELYELQYMSPTRKFMMAARKHFLRIPDHALSLIP